MAKSDSNELMKYRREVPEEVREDMKARLLQAQMSGSYEEFIGAGTYILAHLIGGDISPGIASEARAYLELLMAAITTQEAVKQKNSTSPKAVSAVYEKARKRGRKVIKDKQSENYEAYTVPTVITVKEVR